MLPTETETDPLNRYRRYARMAEQATMIRPRVLLITLGLDPEIRQQVSHQLIDDFGMIRLRSDLERARLFDGDDDSKPQTYRHLLELAELSLRAGFPVICRQALWMQPTAAVPSLANPRVLYLAS
jgi:Predicted kinase